jgi:hypothetical protein
VKAWEQQDQHHQQFRKGQSPRLWEEMTHMKEAMTGERMTLPNMLHFRMGLCTLYSAQYSTLHTAYALLICAANPLDR